MEPTASPQSLAKISQPLFSQKRRGEGARWVRLIPVAWDGGGGGEGHGCGAHPRMKPTPPGPSTRPPQGLVKSRGAPGDFQWRLSEAG